MNIDPKMSWKEIFALVAEMKAEEKRKKRVEEDFDDLDRRDREQKLARDERDKKEERDRAFEQMLATSERLAAFSSRLDDLDAASVRALMRNSEALDQVKAQIDDMLNRADKLPDGRRVFKTEDGTRVFDEHGVELSSAVVDPHSISDLSPRWESFKMQQERKTHIEAERQGLLDYQSKLDQARARLDKSGVTNKDVDALEADLKATMPPAVLNSLGHRGTEVDGPQIGAQDTSATAQPLDKLRAVAPIAPSPM